MPVVIDFKNRINEKKAAEIYGLSHNTLRAYRTRGEGPKYQKTGRRVFYDIDVFEEWLASRTTVHTSTAKG